ncbi:hypothetical protein JYU34_000246 [Plutella xylostella]|uniref:MYND-type domain-containing protein n=1 Tax=Plutella xylostella TaxID=51655 RepID=A0ABQ7R7A1_PLUXY|nr:hypothetical protein JYU34_000246 [Plutella xylostella]
MSRVYEELDPAYAAKCSDVTLYSDPKGFFKTLTDELVTLASSGGWLANEFARAAGDAGKLSAVYAHAELTEALEEVFSRICPLHRGKDTKACTEKRLQAQRALDEGALPRALALACQAVLKSPMTREFEIIDEGVSLALSLWLRSEILLKSDRPKAALEDLKLALKERLPAKMRAQYYWRMGHCYKGCSEPSRAKVSYELAARLLAKDDTALRNLNQDIASLDGMPSKTAENKHCAISLTEGPKQNIPALSKLVKITEEDSKGRFAVASSPIKTGDVLLIESPYAACLLSDFYGTHCLHCFKRLADNEDEAPVWCPKCSGVAFCGSACQAAAVSTYHKYECPFLDLFIGSGMSILSHIALRMVTQAGLETSLQIHANCLSNEEPTVEGSSLNDIEGSPKKSKMKSRKERLNRTKKALKSFDKNFKEESDEPKAEEKPSLQEELELKAAQIYALCTHSELRKEDDYLKRIVVAMFLTECLKKAEFFGKANQETMKKNERAITELILRNLQLLQFNAHEVYETLRTKESLSGVKSVYVAVGIYPTGALFNHECYPAVARYFEGRQLVFRATRPVAPGVVVSENYGPHFLSRGLKERQRALASRYWFKCNCRACELDWPQLKQMTSAVLYKCPNSECLNTFKATSKSAATCIKCSAKVETETVKDLEEIIKNCRDKYQAAAKIAGVNAQEAISSLSSAIDAFHGIASPPHRETQVAQETLRNCFASLGNVHYVPTPEKSENSST